MHSSAAENRKKHHLKLLSLGSRSFKIISVNTIKKHVISAFMVSNMSVPICIHFHDRQANSRKTHFLHAKAGTAIAHLSHRNSVCLSVCLSVTWVDQSKRCKLGSLELQLHCLLPGKL